MGTTIPTRPKRTRRVDPHCPTPDGQPHNTVAAARRGCSCPDGAAALQRDRERDRGRKTRGLSTDPGRVRISLAGPTVPEATTTERALRNRTDLACTGHDTELFAAYGDDVAGVAAAKAVCAACPAQHACLQVALERGDDWMVLGGTTPAERRRIRNEPSHAA